MKTLSKQEINFIDNYLKKSGVQFLDVRLELTDHVASEIEQKMKANEASDFYSALKQYMRIHKRELLKSEKGFRKAMDKKVLRSLLKNAVNPFVILISIILFLGYRQLDFLGFENPITAWLVITMVYSTIMTIILVIAKKQTFLGMQRLAQWWYWFAGLPMLMIKPYIAFLSLGDQFFMILFITINVSLFFIGTKMFHEYKEMRQYV